MLIPLDSFGRYVGVLFFFFLQTEHLLDIACSSMLRDKLHRLSV